MNSDPSAEISRDLDVIQCPVFSEAKLLESEDLTLRTVSLGLLSECVFIFFDVGIMISPLPTSQVDSEDQVKGYKRIYKCPVLELGNGLLNGA